MNFYNIIKNIKTGLLLCILIQITGCNERSSTVTNHTDIDSANFVKNRVEIDSANLNYLRNKSKRIRESADSVFQVYVKRFERSYWYVSMYRCGKEDYKSISKGLDTITFFFAPEKNLYIDNKKAGTWELKRINEILIWMSLNIENSIEEIYLPSRDDYCFWYANDSVVVMQTRHGQSEEEALTYRMSLKRLKYTNNTKSTK